VPAGFERVTDPVAGTPPDTLDGWLSHIDAVHPRTIAMGLERVSAVRQAMNLAPAFPLIIVGGTNGKGSACAMLEAILHHAGYRTGCYTSPHLLRYNERVRIAREEVSDAALVEAFGRVEAARGEIPLTYFEFGTLAAVWLFAAARVDVAILEVGLGGRLDAVNAFDADCAMVMSVDIDHVEYLGDSREQIGFEKAGIMRSGRPAICADPDPPRSLVDHARATGAVLLQTGADFGYQGDRLQWRYWGPGGSRHGLPHPALRGSFQLGNAAACIAALDALRPRLVVTQGDIRAGLLHAENPGRFQVLPGRPTVILDVAHNPHAAHALAANLSQMPRSGRVIAVFGMLRDKDMAGVVQVLAGRITHWFVAGLDVARGADSKTLHAVLGSAGITAVSSCSSIEKAYVLACEMATEDDKIVVFGSFHTVAAVMALRAAGKAV